MTETKFGLNMSRRTRKNSGIDWESSGLLRIQLLDGDTRISRQKRRAFTLIELCVVIGMVTLIATLATTVLHAMMQQQAAIGKQLLVGNSLRLATRFRTDVHAAEKAKVEASTLTLIGPQATISYSHPTPGTIRRTIEADGTTRRDHFDLQDHHEIAFAIDREFSSREIVTLTVRPPEKDPSLPGNQPRYAISPVGMATVAELGRDHRWQDEVAEQ